MTCELVQSVCQGLGLNVQALDSFEGPVLQTFQLDIRCPIAKLQRAERDIAIQLQVPSVRIYVKNGAVFLEIPKEKRDLVLTKDFMDNSGLDMTKCSIPLFIGKNTTGRYFAFDLAKSPHLLVAGTTGSGKSEFLNTAIYVMTHARTTRLVLIDVKMVEFARFENAPQLAVPIVTDAVMASRTLDALVKVMIDRYDTLRQAGCRNIHEYRERVGPMCFYTCVIDEYADLVLQDKTVEKSLVRIAQIGRAAGFHLIVATQKPLVSVVTSLVKANMPTRACFRVATATDSRVVLDQSGGEKLLGQGDVLWFDADGIERFHTPLTLPEDWTVDQLGEPKKGFFEKLFGKR